MDTLRKLLDVGVKLWGSLAYVTDRENDEVGQLYYRLILLLIELSSAAAMLFKLLCCDPAACALPISKKSPAAGAALSTFAPLVLLRRLRLLRFLKISRILHRRLEGRLHLHRHTRRPYAPLRRSDRQA